MPDNNNENTTTQVVEEVIQKVETKNEDNKIVDVKYTAAYITTWINV